MSDWFGLNMLAGRHAVSENNSDAALLGVHDCMDIELPKPEVYPYLIQHVKE